MNAGVWVLFALAGVGGERVSCARESRVERFESLYGVESRGGCCIEVANTRVCMCVCRVLYR